MGKQAGYWVNRIRPSFKARAQKQSEEGSSGSEKNDSKPRNPENQKNENLKKEDCKHGTENGKRVMVVVDATVQAKNALRWALTHCVQDDDNILLLYVMKPPKVQALGGETHTERASRAYEQVQHLKNFCQLKKPNVKTEIMVVETGEEKGRTIVEESKKQRAGLLVLGQRKRPSRWRVIWTWRSRKTGNGNGVVEYCIHNANCMAIAVRKKSNNGGYLITTKRHKDFWLLA